MPSCDVLDMPRTKLGHTWLSANLWVNTHLPLVLTGDGATEAETKTVGRPALTSSPFGQMFHLRQSIAESFTPYALTCRSCCILAAGTTCSLQGPRSSRTQGSKPSLCGLPTWPHLGPRFVSKGTCQWSHIMVLAGPSLSCTPPMLLA